MTAKRCATEDPRIPMLRARNSHARLIACASALGVLTVFSLATSAAADDPRNPAHELAERFARQGKPSTSDKPRPVDAAKAEAERQAVEQQRAYEEEMLARARAEAEARLKADMDREQDAARERAAAEARARQTEERTRQAEAEAAAQRRAIEAEAERAREADNARAEAEARARAEAERLARAREQETRKLAERLRAARRAREEARARAAAEVAAKADMEARQARARAVLRQRTQRLFDRLASLRSERERRSAELSHPAKMGAPITTASTGRQPVAPVEEPHVAASGVANAPVAVAGHTTGAASRADRVTVLIVMAPGSRGIRRWNKTADPMLCVEGTCYIADGPGKAARSLSRSKAFGPSVALGDRAGACNNTLSCVFRNVELPGTTAWMQPIDLRIVRHDRREARRVAADPTCNIERGYLACQRTIEAADYRAWIVPEELARAAGPSALQTALESGLATRVLAHKH